MSLASYPFKKQQYIEVVHDNGLLPSFLRQFIGKKLVIHDVQPTFPRNLDVNGHHRQEIRVVIIGESEISDWLSGCWFRLA